MGRLTTHVLDVAHGTPAAGMHIELWTISPAGNRATLVCSVITNADGRLDAPLLANETMHVGVYELDFDVELYFADRGTPQHTPAFLTRVPVRFGIANSAAHYHVPLLVSPWAYSTYRGS